MGAPGEEVGGHGVLHLVATFLQQRHVTGQGCGIAGDVNDAPGRHPVEGFNGIGIQALPWWIHSLNIRDSNHIA